MRQVSLLIFVQSADVVCNFPIGALLGEDFRYFVANIENVGCRLHCVKQATRCLTVKESQSDRKHRTCKLSN